MNTKYRKEVSGINAYIAGRSIDEVKKEYSLDDVVKLASNENPLGPSPLATEAMRKIIEQVNFYPDPDAVDVRKVIASRTGVKTSQVIVGSGGVDILNMIAQTFIDEGDEVVAASTTYTVFEKAVTMMGGKLVKVDLKEDLTHDLKKMADSITFRTKVVYIVNPNNPVGNIINAYELGGFVEKIPDNVVLFLDEAYYEYARQNPQYPDSVNILKNRKNMVILRTFSKASGLAGIRVGYALATDHVARGMRKVVSIFNVNRLAQAAALGALSDDEHIKNTLELNNMSMRMMEGAFNDMKLRFIPSNSNFIFVNVGMNSLEVADSLMRKGVIIRPGSAWKWDDWIRVSTGTVEQTQKFIDALKETV